MIETRIGSLLFVAPALCMAACGSSAPAEQPDPTPATAGDEEPAPVAEETPPPLRTTIPVPVPQPGVARDQLSAALQELWDEVERVVEIRPPEPPTGATEEAVQAWAEGPFASWLSERMAAMDRLGQRATALAQASPPPHELIAAAALLGYAYEDMAAGVRGAPVPEGIAADPELLEVYVGALAEATRPMAAEAARGYGHCVRLFTEHEPEAWAQWGIYCDSRGAEVVEVFELETAAAP